MLQLLLFRVFSTVVERQKIWVDKGKEFYNKDIKSKSCSLYSTENEEKSCVVERWNRTMKEKMFKYFSANSTRKYLNVLDEMVNNYNNTWHSSIKMIPSETSLKKNETAVYKFVSLSRSTEHQA